MSRDDWFESTYGLSYLELLFREHILKKSPQARLDFLGREDTQEFLKKYPRVWPEDIAASYAETDTRFTRVAHEKA